MAVIEVKYFVHFVIENFIFKKMDPTWLHKKCETRVLFVSPTLAHLNDANKGSK